MKALSLSRVLSAFFVLMLGVSLAYAGSVLPRPSVNGPSLGDPTTNLDSIELSLQNNTFSNFSSFTTLTVNAANTTSTVLNPGFNFLTAAVGVTGTMLLPTAKPGAQILVANNTGVVVTLFPNGTAPFTAGGVDFINNIAYAAGGIATLNGFVVTNGLAVNCFVPQGGNWWCR